LYIRNVTGTTTVTRVTPQYVEEGWLHILQGKPIPDYVAVFRIHGPFLFGANDKITQVAECLHELPPIVILRLRNMTAIDATGLHRSRTWPKNAAPANARSSCVARRLSRPN
jgi:SulP family sulfate permease